MTMKWKNGTSWETVPSAALYGTYGGTLHVEYPQPEDKDGLGRPCGAVGRPRIVIETPFLTETGMAFWRARFPDTSMTWVGITVEVFDHRAGSTVRYDGLLLRPEFSGVSMSSSTKIYRNVRIIIAECRPTT